MLNTDNERIITSIQICMLSGIQGQLWSETIRTPEQFDEMLYPRLLALAERAWRKADWEDQDGELSDVLMEQDWERFSQVLAVSELPKLDDLEVAYHIRPPGLRG